MKVSELIKVLKKNKYGIHSAKAQRQRTARKNCPLHIESSRVEVRKVLNMKYVYPAIFTKEKGKYDVQFPDIPGCVTCGDSLEEAIYMAEDALALILFSCEKEGREIPKASEIGWLNPDKNEFASYVACDTLEYHRRNSKKAVKKTLSIPEWLNEEAVAQNVNFSQVLQEALKARLGIHI